MAPSKIKLLSSLWSRDYFLLKSKDVLYQVSSDLGEVNNFSSSSSDEDQKASLSRVRKTLPSIGLLFKPELLFFILNFLAAFKGKGLHMDRNESFDTWNFILLEICFKHRFN